MINIIRESARGIERVRIDDEFFRNRKLFLTTPIDAFSSSDLIKNLMYLEQESSEEITLYINSPGGEVTSGLALFDFISTMKAPVKTVCIGTAASMAAIIFLAGSKRLMYPHTRIMIHDPSYSNNDISGRKPHEIQRELDVLNEAKNVLVEIIADKTGKRIKDIEKLTANDTFYSAEEAVKFGLATGVLKENYDD